MRDFSSDLKDLRRRLGEATLQRAQFASVIVGLGFAIQIQRRGEADIRRGGRRRDNR